MPGITSTQSIRYGLVSDPIDWTMQRDEADDIAAQLDLADAAKLAALGRPVVSAQRFAGLSVPVSTTTLIPWDSEIFDTHGMLDTAGPNPSRVTVTTASGTGHYFISVRSSTVNPTGWNRGDLHIYRNGTLHRSRSLWFGPGGPINVSGIVYLGTVGDYLDARIYHEGGGTTTMFDGRLYVFKLCNA